MYYNFKQAVAGANTCSAMGRETIQKSRVSPKNDRSRVNNLMKWPSFLVFLLSIMLMGTSCKNDTVKEDEVGDTVEVNQTSENLEEDYNAWFQLYGKYVEYFHLQMPEVQVSERNWDKEGLVVALVENVADKERGGFFVAKNIYFPIAALDEEIATLENIAEQIKRDLRKYNCTRRYVTSYGIIIVFQYSSSDSKWTTVEIAYNSDKSSVKIKPDYLLSYIRGLKDCRQRIADFKAGKWSNS
jgi:hypothetical protein